ncbi:hypothetical protein LS70_003930 [Helicobacter sp. MIT 11-5569]|uniref:hypothetical protein n=1 Tax=Helicobacter sp. MIT 11-5569 TaxID=1548151 RepID=UPI00051FAF92|nr:hypothetical protein [Helicobacter sp. MIT 11-5569]TLD83965.1 hypothetical protein LS70_003930 [Helicobacter sp. MIT 11-5569]
MFNLQDGYFKSNLTENSLFDWNNLANTATNASGGFNFNNFLESKALQGGLEIGGFAKDLFNSWNTYYSGKKALKEQKRGNDILQNQLNIENQRYNEREAERKAANAQIAASASVWNRQ